MANKRFIVRHGLDNSGDNSVVNTITNVAEPVNNSDAATKYYVDTHTTGGTVTAVTATSPVESTGGTAPVISLGTGANGQLVIGTGTGFTKSTLTAGSGVSIANASGSITISATGSGGDVTGPNSSTDNAVVRFDGLSGKIIQDSTATLSDAGLLTVSELSTTSITSTGGATITIAPNGMGDVHLNADSVRIGDNNTDAILTTHGTGDLILTTNEGSTTEGIIRLYDGANGNITLTPNGTGQVQVGSDQVVTLTASQTLTNKSLSGSSNTFTNIPNSATTAASANTASAIVARDASGNFSAGTITATLSGNASNITASSNTSLTSLVNLATVGTITSGTWTAGTIGVSYGGTGLTTLTAGYIPYGNGTSAFGSSANLFWDSTNSRLGIGTSSPAYKLHILSADGVTTSINAAATGRIRAFGYIDATRGALLDSINTAENAYLPFTLNGSVVQFQTGATERMRIDSSGNVGIGNTPSEKLQIGSNSGNNYTRIDAGTNGISGIKLYAGNSYRSALYYNDAAGTTYLSTYAGSSQTLALDGAGTILFQKNGSEQVRIDTNGNVGIGTASPSYQITVGTAGTTANSYIQIASTTSGTGNLFFGDTAGTGSGSYRGYIQYDHNVDAMVLGTSASERMRIDSSGNVVIGATSTSQRLRVVSSTATSSQDVLNVDGGDAGFSGSNDAGTAFSLIFNACAYSVSTGIVQRTGASIAMAKEKSWNEADTGTGTYGALVFKTNSGTIATPSLTERMRIDSSGNLTVSGNATFNSSLSGGLRINGADASVNQIWQSNSGTNLGIMANGGAILFGQTSSEKMRLDASGNLGVGTASPSEKLSIKSATSNSVVDIASLTNPSQTSAGVRMLFNNGYGNLCAISSFQLDNGAGADNGVLAFQTASDTVLSTKMTILDTGNVGIGTASPSTKLHVSNAGVSAQATFVGTTGSPYITVVGNSGTTILGNESNGGWVGTVGSQSFVFKTTDIERMRITSGGDVAIGNSSPSEKLHVTGKIKASDVLLGNNGTKGFGAITTATSAPTAGSGASGDHYYVY